MDWLKSCCKDSKGSSSFLKLNNPGRQYNPLNLPSQITTDSGTITTHYTFSGEKIMVEMTNNSNDPTVGMNLSRLYLGGMEFEHDNPSGTWEDFEPRAYYFGDGRYLYEGDRYQYNLTDHLGNTVVIFEDKDGDGEITQTTDPQTNEVIDRYHYYSFGLRWEVPEPYELEYINENHYRYNSKEWDRISEWYDYGWRWYDPVIGRLNGVDPLADASANIGTSPYAYVWNNPLKFIDPDGRHGESVDDIYVFNKDGTFSGEVLEAPGEDVGMVRDFYGEGENMTFNFVDPENTPILLVTPDALSQMQIKIADNGEFFIDRIEYQAKFDIQAQLMSADAFGPNPGSLYSLLTESRGFGARLDYSAKGSLLDRTSTLFLTEGANGNYTGHDFRNYGNFLWGATTKTWGVPGFIARMGANADVMWNEGNWDSGDDQRSIQLGRDYAKQMGWKRRSF